MNRKRNKNHPGKEKRDNTTKSRYTVAASFPSMACRWKKKYKKKDC
jgi:hypothetical protein